MSLYGIQQKPPAADASGNDDRRLWKIKLVSFQEDEYLHGVDSSKGTCQKNPPQ